uniref:Uncharacterized protein n=2 Tax=Sphaerodactylus townsendi TaxID=933632 RepID=A0ACB8FSQ4_9SAUR
MAHLKQELREDFMNLRRTVTEKVNSILAGKFVRQLTQNITDPFFQVGKNLNDLKQMLPTETKEVYDLVLKRSWGMWREARNALNEQKRRLSSATEGMSETLSSISKPYIDPILRRAAPYTEDLRRILATKVTELSSKMNKSLAQRLEDLGPQLSPYVEAVQNQWGKLQTSSETFTTSMKEQLQQRLETINNTWVKTFLTPLLAPFQPPAED